MTIWLALALAGVQTLSAPAIDPATLPTKADVASAIAAAQAAQAAAAASCKAMPAVPPSEMVGGTAGTAAAGCRPADAAQPRITRATIVTTDSAGTYAVTWKAPLAAAPVTLPIPVNGTSEPVVCNVTTTTSTGATGRCWYARTLPATITTLTALLNFDPFGASASNIAVQILAIPTTQ